MKSFDLSTLVDHIASQLGKDIDWELYKPIGPHEKVVTTKDEEDIADPSCHFILNLCSSGTPSIHIHKKSGFFDHRYEKSSFIHINDFKRFEDYFFNNTNNDNFVGIEFLQSEPKKLSNINSSFIIPSMHRLIIDNIKENLNINVGCYECGLSNVSIAKLLSASLLPLLSSLPKANGGGISFDIIVPTPFPIKARHLIAEAVLSASFLVSPSRNTTTTCTLKSVCSSATSVALGFYKTDQARNLLKLKNGCVRVCVVEIGGEFINISVVQMEVAGDSLLEKTITDGDEIYLPEYNKMKEMNPQQKLDANKNSDKKRRKRSPKKKRKNGSTTFTDKPIADSCVNEGENTSSLLSPLPPPPHRQFETIRNVDDIKNNYSSSSSKSPNEAAAGVVRVEASAGTFSFGLTAGDQMLIQTWLSILTNIQSNNSSITSLGLQIWENLPSLDKYECLATVEQFRQCSVPDNVSTSNGNGIRNFYLQINPLCDCLISIIFKNSLAIYSFSLNTAREALDIAWRNYSINGGLECLDNVLRRCVKTALQSQQFEEPLPSPRSSKLKEGEGNGGSGKKSGKDLIPLDAVLLWQQGRGIITSSSSDNHQFLSHSFVSPSRSRAENPIYHNLHPDNLLNLSINSILRDELGGFMEFDDIEIILSEPNAPAVQPEPLPIHPTHQNSLRAMIEVATSLDNGGEGDVPKQSTYKRNGNKRERKTCWMLFPSDQQSISSMMEQQPSFEISAPVSSESSTIVSPTRFFEAMTGAMGVFISDSVDSAMHLKSCSPTWIYGTQSSDTRGEMLVNGKRSKAVTSTRDTLRVILRPKSEGECSHSFSQFDVFLYHNWDIDDDKIHVGLGLESKSSFGTLLGSIDTSFTSRYDGRSPLFLHLVQNTELTSISLVPVCTMPLSTSSSPSSPSPSISAFKMGYILNIANSGGLLSVKLSLLEPPTPSLDSNLSTLQHHEDEENKIPLYKRVKSGTSLLRQASSEQCRDLKLATMSSSNNNLRIGKIIIRSLVNIFLFCMIVLFMSGLLHLPPTHSNGSSNSSNSSNNSVLKQQFFRIFVDRIPSSFNFFSSTTNNTHKTNETTDVCTNISMKSNDKNKVTKRNEKLALPCILDVKKEKHESKFKPFDFIFRRKKNA